MKKPDEHAQAAAEMFARAEALGIEAEVAAYRAALHATLATKAGTGPAYARADAALAELAELAERGELGKQALEDNWFVEAQRLADLAES